MALNGKARLHAVQGSYYYAYNSLRVYGGYYYGPEITDSVQA